MNTINRWWWILLLIDIIAPIIMIIYFIVKRRFILKIFLIVLGILVVSFVAILWQEIVDVLMIIWRIHYEWLDNKKWDYRAYRNRCARYLHSNVRAKGFQIGNYSYGDYSNTDDCCNHLCSYSGLFIRDLWLGRQKY